MRTFVFDSFEKAIPIPENKNVEKQITAAASVFPCIPAAASPVLGAPRIVCAASAASWKMKNIFFAELKCDKMLQKKCFVMRYIFGARVATPSMMARRTPPTTAL